MWLVLHVLLLTSASLQVTGQGNGNYSRCYSNTREGQGWCVHAYDRRCNHLTKVLIGRPPPSPENELIRCKKNYNCCVPPEEEEKKGKQCGLLNKGRGNPSDPFGVEPREVPWTVAIMQPLKKEGEMHAMKFLINGVLIHEKIVMTTAHSVMNKIFYKNIDEKSLYAVIGDYDQWKTDTKRRALKVLECEIHEDADIRRKYNNIALFRLQSSALDLVPHAGLACLPQQNSAVLSGTECFFTGWGLNANNIHESILTLTKVEMPDRETCNLELRRGGPGESLGVAYEMHNTLLCAGGEPNLDVCKSDGGSPLVCPIKGTGRYVVAGLLSYTKQSCKGHAVFTNNMVLVSWIEGKLHDWHLDVQNVV